jgi:hypothetical protein
MDAILEYTGMANFPRIFSEDGVLAANSPYLKKKLNDIENDPKSPGLPQRMNDNRLHRFSKVLETNIGADQTASTRLLPQCRRLKPGKAQPLNRTAPTNLYRAQKLMSLSSNIDLESLMISKKQKPKENSADNTLHEVDDWLGNMANFASMENDENSPFHRNRSTYHISNQMLFWIFCLLCILCYIGYKCYRKRRKFFLRRKLRNVNIRSVSSHFFLNNKSTSPEKSHGSMSPPTSPRTVYVDKISSRRKRDNTSMTTMQTDDTIGKNSQDELVNVSNSNNYNQNTRLSSHDTYKRIV